jgi:hypothetical protein
LTPVAFICKLSSLVKKFAPAVHLVVSPLAFVVASVLVEKFTMAVSLTVEFVPLVSGASFVLLDDVLVFRKINGSLSISDSGF